MNKRLLLCCAVASLILSGCATDTRSANPCNDGVCKVSVRVTDCAGWRGISVDPDPIRVPSPNRIEWTIETDGYRFANNGIVINDPDGTEFDEPTRTPNGKKFSWRDKYTKQGKEYKYIVNVMREGGGNCRAYDPWIYH